MPMKKQLTQKQKDQFKEHSKHHTPAHIRRMKKEIMENGKSFTEAHNIAKKLDKKKPATKTKPVVKPKKKMSTY